jgi:hypothetical protein
MIVRLFNAKSYFVIENSPFPTWPSVLLLQMEAKHTAELLFALRYNVAGSGLRDMTISLLQFPFTANLNDVLYVRR